MGIELAIASAIVGGAASASQAAQMNRAAQNAARRAADQAKKRYGAIRERELILREQVSKRSDQQRLETVKRSARERGARLAAAAGAGVGFSGTTETQVMNVFDRRDELMATIGSNTMSDLKTIASQSQNQIFDTEAAMQNTMAQAESMLSSPFLSGLSGALSGASAGYNLGSGLETAGIGQSFQFIPRPPTPG